VPLLCQACPLSRRSHGFCPDWVGPMARLFFVLKAPGKYEINLKRPLSGGTGIWFERHLLEPFDLSWDDIAVINVIRCYPGPNFPTGEIGKQAVARCRGFDPKLPPLTIVTYNPANVFRDRNIVKFLERSVDLALSFAEPVTLLCGQEALETFAPELTGGLKKWQRHYFIRNHSMR